MRHAVAIVNFDVCDNTTYLMGFIGEILGQIGHNDEDMAKRLFGTGWDKE